MPIEPRVISVAILLLTLGYGGVLLYPFEWRPPRPVENGVHASSSGLAFAGPGIAYTRGAPHWLDKAIGANELAVALEIRPSAGKQYGPARILSLSKDVFTRNLTIGQSGEDLVIRLRTPSTDLNGIPQSVIRGVLKPLAWRRIDVSIRSGEMVVKVDGDVVLERVLPASPLEGWDRTYPLVLGNELTGNRPWYGEIGQATIVAGEEIIDYGRPGVLRTPKRFWFFQSDRPDPLPKSASMKDIVQNILLFLPLGALLQLRAGQRAGLKEGLVVVAVAAAISTFFEALQVAFNRDPSAMDALCNAAGAMLGFLMAMAVRRPALLSR
jgi:VanZ family protein